jgi:hypothetical protein
MAKEKPSLRLDTSEAVVVQAAAAIYAAQIAAGKVTAGQEKEFMKQAIREAVWIARTTDEAIRSDDEMG